MKRWKGYEHGINLGGWLSQCNHTKDRYDNFIIEEDIRRISTWGLDHIRVPIDYNLVEDELMLSLPMVIMHPEGECEMPEGGVYGKIVTENTESNPFAVLGKLKKS